MGGKETSLVLALKEADDARTHRSIAAIGRGGCSRPLTHVS